jgi:hypothetical protein
VSRLIKLVYTSLRPATISEVIAGFDQLIASRYKLDALRLETDHVTSAANIAGETEVGATLQMFDSEMVLAHRDNCVYVSNAAKVGIDNHITKQHYL